MRKEREQKMREETMRLIREEEDRIRKREEMFKVCSACPFPNPPKTAGGTVALRQPPEACLRLLARAITITAGQTATGAG